MESRRQVKKAGMAEESATRVKRLITHRVSSKYVHILWLRIVFSEVSYKYGKGGIAYGGTGFELEALSSTYSFQLRSIMNE